MIDFQHLHCSEEDAAAAISGAAAFLLSSGTDRLPVDIFTMVRGMGEVQLESYTQFQIHTGLSFEKLLEEGFLLSLSGQTAWMPGSVFKFKILYNSRLPVS